MTPHLTAVFLAIYAGCALIGIAPAALLVRHPAAIALILAVAAFTATVLASGAAELW
jgi:hypothetical protein